jgi:hypothetical protein
MSEEPPDRPLYRWSLIAFGAPGAIAVLAKLDESLDFGPLLRRIVLGFNTVSLAIWKYIGEILNFDLTEYHGALSLTLICTGILISQRNGNENLELDRWRISFFVEIFSASLLVSVVGFGIKSSDLYQISLVTLFIFLSLSIYIGTSVRITHGAANGFFKIVAIILLSAVAAYLDPSATYVAVGFGSAILISTVIESVGVMKMVMTKIVVFAIGVYAIDFVSRVFLPRANEILDGIGA